jgi:biopolymer transport protein ExbD
MKFRARQYKRTPIMRLPLVALIDVVLFLLFYFMIAASFTGEENTLASTLGAEGKGGRSTDLQPQIVSVVVEGGKVGFRLGERWLDDRAALTNLLNQLPRQAGVIVKSAGEAPVWAAAAALQASKDAGFTKVSYVPTTK